ncbi:VOC family protein, partial [Parvibaculum sp.]|uniref:VOC family protein n=1 Tax=Parvibaculum sp. TaxID=2024848 RepID=UPI0034A039F6
PHFGLILDWRDWHELADRLRAARIPFAVEPHIRFAGEAGEQATMFFRDPAGNALEFKAFQNEARIFARTL